MNYKKLSVGIIGAVTIFSVLVIISVPKNEKVLGTKSAQDVESQIKTESKTYDFGTISMKNGKVSHTYTIKNESPEKVEITKIETSCMCTKATFITKTGTLFGPFGMSGHGGFAPIISVFLQPNEESKVEVVFDPAAHGSAGIGKITRSVFVYSKSNPDLELIFTAYVKP